MSGGKFQLFKDLGYLFNETVKQVILSLLFLVKLTIKPTAIWVLIDTNLSQVV